MVQAIARTSSIGSSSLSSGTILIYRSFANRSSFLTLGRQISNWASVRLSPPYSDCRLDSTSTTTHRSHFVLPRNRTHIKLYSTLSQGAVHHENISRLQQKKSVMDSIARIVSQSKPYLVPGKLQVTEFWFEVPLNYSKPNGKKIKLFARRVVNYERPIIEPSPDDKTDQKPYLVYLQGGPGMGCPQPQDSPLSKFIQERGYVLLLLDSRGVGSSTTISADTLKLIGGPQEQADYLKLFRADNIVRDCEAVRKCLTKDYPPEKQKWTTWGQSFGGMTTLTYLSFHPEGLRESFITGGLVATDLGPDEVYQRTYLKAMERNEAYYKKFPQDIMVVKELAAKIRELGGTEGIVMPAGARLTVPLLLTMGINFGLDYGLDRVHNLVLKMKGDLDQFGFFTRNTLNSIEQNMSWDLYPIYSILHEPIWCHHPGIASKWAAERVGKSLGHYQWLDKDWTGPESLKDDEPLYFSGEAVFPFYFDAFPDLRKMKQTAQILAEFDQWPALYDDEQLKKNEVPVYAACYNDMYVFPDTARETAAKIKDCKVWESNVHYHGALRSKPDDVFRELLKLRDDTID